MRSGIYIILNLRNRKRYVGSSKNIQTRLYYHKWQLNRGDHGNPHLQRAWNKGNRDFAFVQVTETEPSQLIKTEQFFLDGIKPEYNICTKASGGRCAPHTEQAKANMSKAQKKASKTRVAWNKGKVGVFSPEAIKKISDAAKKQKRRTGHKFTEEHKKKLSDAKQGHIPWSKGKRFSSEHRQKLSEAKLGKKMKTRSKEHCLKISEAKKLYWQQRKQKQQTQ